MSRLSVQKADWKIHNNPNEILNKMATYTKRVPNDIPTESRNYAPLWKDISWWNEDIKMLLKSGEILKEEKE